MAKAVVDPNELKRFARDLSRFNAELQSLTGGLRARMNSLEASWRDQEQRKFAEEFNQTVKVLGHFVETSEQHVSFLMAKANHIEAYLNQR